MTDKLHQHANDTTPKGVTVEPTITGLMTWALGRFGAGAIFLAAVVVMYNDLKEERAATLILLRENIEVLSATSTNLGAVNETLKRLEDHHEAMIGNQ